MFRWLLRTGVTVFYSSNLFHVFVMGVVVADALTDSIIDNVIYVVFYPAYGGVYETSVPYFLTYLLPTKPIRRFIFIFYIPVMYVWRAGRRTRQLPERNDNLKCFVNEKNGLPRMQQHVLGQSKQLHVRMPKTFVQRMKTQMKNHHDVYQWLFVYLWISCQKFVVATKYIQKLWNVSVLRLIATIKNAGSWFKQSKTANELQPSTCKEQGQSKKQLLLKLRGQSISWGELVHLSDDRYQTVLKNFSKRLQFYRLLPLKASSRLWGQFSQLQLPVWLRNPTFRVYIWLFGCRLEDALEQDLEKYRSLGDFFQRSLRRELRPIDSTSAVISPVDGTVLHFGRIESSTLEQVKGVTYSLKGFLGPMEEVAAVMSSSDDMKPVTLSKKPRVVDDDFLGIVDIDDLDYYRGLMADPSHQLFQCIIYLAPGDYHCFHSPVEWTIFARRHFPGELFSVNPGVARWLQGLFNFNERAVYYGRWQHGFFSMTAVGATNVGSINVHFDERLSTNTQSSWDTGCFYDAFFKNEQRPDGVKLQRGDDFGKFNLGSTVVLLFEAPATFQFCVEPRQKLRYGQGIGIGVTSENEDVTTS